MNHTFITDLDHTFLRNDLTISQFSKDIWNKMAEDHIMSVATARAHKKTEQFLQGFNVNAPMILLDGSLIMGTDKKIIDKKTLDNEIANEIINHGLIFGLEPFILALDKESEIFLYPKNGNKYQQDLLPRYINDDNLILEDEIYPRDENFKISYMADKDTLTIFQQELIGLFGDSITSILAPEAYMGCYYLTVLHPDANKSSGLKTVSDYLGVDLAKVSVFGDNFNDIGMFELAGTSIAVSNAQQDVKDKAHIVLPHSNDEDAVAKYLQGLSL